VELMETPTPCDLIVVTTVTHFWGSLLLLEVELMETTVTVIDGADSWGISLLLLEVELMET